MLVGRAAPSSWLTVKPSTCARSSSGTMSRSSVRPDRKASSAARSSSSTMAPASAVDRPCCRRIATTGAGEGAHDGAVDRPRIGTTLSAIGLDASSSAARVIASV
jgi:hypothetical protein